MIKKGKKRIIVTLDEDVIQKALDWEWRRPSWSYDVNEALRIFYKLMDKNNPVARILNDKSKK